MKKLSNSLYKIHKGKMYGNGLYQTQKKKLTDSDKRLRLYSEYINLSKTEIIDRLTQIYSQVNPNAAYANPQFSTNSCQNVGSRTGCKSQYLNRSNTSAPLG